MGEVFDLTLFMTDLEHFKVVLELGKDSVDYFWLVAIMLGINLTMQAFLGAILFFIQVNLCNACTGTALERWSKIAVYLTVLVAMTDVFIGVFGSRTKLLHQGV